MTYPMLERATSSDAQTVPVVGLPLVMVTITSVFLGLSLISNSMRAYVSTAKRTIGLDDALVAISQLAYLAVSGTTVKAALTGVGTLNSGLNDFLLVESQKWYFMWIISYLIGMVTLKTAVCVTLLRILPPTQRKMRLAVWALLSWCWVAWAIDFLAVLFLCRPIEASWDSSLVTQGKAECGSQNVLIIISNILTAASISTDIGCTVLPGIMLWQTQMHNTSKLEVFVLLSIASVASIATIIRAPYFSHYSNPGDNLSYWCGYMILYSNIETGVGLCASALPGIRRFYFMMIKPRRHEPNRRAPTKPDSHPLVTFGGSGRPGRHSSGRRDNTAVDWERLVDDGSDKGILFNTESNTADASENSKSQIRVEQSFEVSSQLRTS